MALAEITNWPFKIIDGYKSEWNAANLPMIYEITNTKWPTNSEDATVAITSVTDSNGNAELNHGSSTGILAKGWVLVSGTTSYNGVQRVLSINGNNLIIDAPYVASETGNSQVYYNNYTTLVRVYAGLDPAHPHAADKPMVLIGTIEERPDTDNITRVDVRDYVKNKMSMVYDKTQEGWPNDLNGWCDFYISYAERYDESDGSTVTNFTSEYRDDSADGGINYLKAAQSALQFGNARGGNLHDYIVKIVPYGDDAIFMTDFDEPRIIGDQEFNISIIMDDVFPAYLQIETYDINGTLLNTITDTITDEGYGLYRLPVHVDLSNPSIDHIKLSVHV